MRGPLRLLAQATSPPATPSQKFDALRNPYRSKRQWPPDFQKLSSQQQLRFEKKYKRRLKLTWARPRFHKIVQIVQWVSITGAVGWMTLYVDWGDGNESLQPIRDWVAGKSSYLLQPIGSTTVRTESERYENERLANEAADQRKRASTSSTKPSG